MTAGYILVFVILILGGVIATVSDRLGTKVGKARLSLFKLRPRDTAVVVTVMAGSILSATTLGILFATSKPLRTGVFRIDEIQKRLNNARRELNLATEEKKRVETELSQARAAQAQAKANLEEINRSLQMANAEQAQTQTKLKSLRAQLNNVEAAKSKTQQQLSQVEAAKSQTEKQLATMEAAKLRTEEQLTIVEVAKASTQSQLDRTENQLKTVSTQKKALGSEITQLQTERQQLIEQRERVKTQIAQRDQEIAQRNQEIAKREGEIAQRDQEIGSRNKLIAQRDKEIAERVQNLADRDRAIVDRDKVIAEREALLETLAEQQTQLEQQQALLQQQVQVLERDFQAIREGTVAIRRGQILAAGVVRIAEPALASRAIDRLLQEANKTTVGLMQPGNTKVKEQIVQITNAEIEQLLNQIKDGQDYVVRIVAGANYLREEKRIKVFAEAEINRVVFRAGDVIAGVSIDPLVLKDEQVRQQLQQLIEACQFRARLIGVVGGRVQVADNRIETLASFVDRLKQYDKPLEVQAIATDVTYIAGPLKIDLVAVENGIVVFRTGQQKL
ncbi:DUF3084 domain-containing protein [Microcoleus sp.]|uniref:DUF3084 domain-containing protein n=1 Tax=Microcoleus sp. TaxID=44472 RepID=UPI003524D097